MAVINLYKITVNIKNKTLGQLPQITANDSVVFDVEVYDDTSLFSLSPDYIYMLVTKKRSGKSVIREGSLVDGLIRFELGSSEMTEPGKVEATVQILDETNKRVSTARFDYIIAADPSTQGGLPTDDKTLVIANESLMLDSIQKSEDATQIAETASLKAEEQKQRVDELISSTPQPSEVVDARGGEVVLGNRLNKFDALLAQTPKKGEIVKSDFKTSNDADLLDLNIFNEETRAILQGLTPGQINAVLGLLNVKRENIAMNAVGLEKTAFLTLGKNLFNKDDSIIGAVLTSDSANYGGTVPNTDYNVSGYIPVFANQTYAISNCRHYALYDLNKQTVSFYNNTNNPPVTVTPTQDGYLRVSIRTTFFDKFQVEKGNVTTTYEPYQVIFPYLKQELEPRVQNLERSVSGDISVQKTGEVFIISSKLDSQNDISIETQRNGSTNGSFNFIQTKIGNDVVHSNSDDVTPIRTFTTVGANHGYTTVVAINVTNHGKATKDLGSKWTDGVTTYTLLDIIGNKLIFGCPYTVVDGVVTSTLVNPVGTLTHVSGAANTTSVPVTSKDSDPQLFPSINNKSVKYILDGKEITEDGTYYGSELQVQEKYNVMDYKSIIDFAQSNIGVSYKNDNIEGVVNLSITYTFTKGCQCYISHTFKALKKVSTLNCGFLQSMVMAFANHSVKRYMPNVLAKSGYDFKNIVDLANYNTSLVFLKADYDDPNKPPNRYVDWLEDGAGKKKVGFSMGYIIDKTDSQDAKRNLNTDRGWDLRNTKKSYPIAMRNLTLNAGEYKTFLGYRNYLSPLNVGDATNINIVRDKKDVYVYLDYHKSVTGVNVKLDDCIGKEVTILDSQNFTLYNDVVDSDGVTYSITGNYGYAVLKIR